MSLILDSTTVIALIRGRTPDVRVRFDAARLRDERVVLSSLVYHEVAYGALCSARPDHNLSLVDAFASAVAVEPWRREDALEAARVRTELTRAGTPIGFADTLIAGHARSRGHILVTGNLRHFALVADLTLIDWSISSDPIDPSPYRTSLRPAPEETDHG